MKPKTMILMVVAVVCGLAASYMTSRVIADRTRSDNASEEEKVKVLVARQKLPMGVLIKDPEKYFMEKAYTKGEEPKKAIRSPDQVKDRRLNKPLSEEQFVTAEDLLDPKQASLEAVLPPGMRAVALKVNAASVVAGFVLPNSRVDVLQTTRFGEHSVTQTLLQNMLVLATDMQDQRDPERKASLASTVTVAAKPEDAQKLRLAEAIGELSLALRGAEDQEIVTLKGTRPQDLAKSGNANAGPGGDEGEGEGGTGGAIAKLPSDLSPPSAPPAGPDKKEGPPPAPPKTVTQIIFNGESVTKTIFLLGKEGDVSTQVEKTGMEREPRAEKKPAEPEKEAPAKPDKADGDAAPAPPAPKGKGQPEPGTKKDGGPAAKPAGAH
jgi:pilus assembly protein CpaB